MTISPLTKRISTFLLSKGLLVVVNRVGGIVKVLDMVPSIPFRFIPGLANEIFNRTVITFFYFLFVKLTDYLKGFGGIGFTVEKHSGEHVKTRAME